MKKTIAAFIFVAFLFPLVNASAAMMNGVKSSQVTTGHSMDDGEAAGQALLQKLESKIVVCKDLSQTDYESIGDYYMGIMTGSYHEVMEERIEKTYGADYLRAMHIAMGERFSGCNTDAPFPSGMMGFAPIMGNGSGDYTMMGSGMNPDSGGMGGGEGTRGGVFMVLLFVFAILGLMALIKWFVNLNTLKK